MQTWESDIILFLIGTTIVIMLLATFVVVQIFIFLKNKHKYEQSIKDLQSEHEKNMMAAQLEIREDTLQHISREIHDDVNLGLTLAKLTLNTFDWSDERKARQQMNSSIEILSATISKLGNISKSLNSEVILNQGLLNAIQKEIERIRLTGVCNINSNITGNPVYLDNNRELIIFRIIQETFNNIIKHANAQFVSLVMHYSPDQLFMSISDSGKGFEVKEEGENPRKDNAGLRNINSRIKMIRGSMSLKSLPGIGTSLTFVIPFK